MLTAVLGVIGAAIAGFRRFGMKALLILALAAATVGFFAWAKQVLAQPQSTVVQPAAVRLDLTPGQANR